MQYLQIVLVVLEIVKLVEKLMPEKGKGAEKLTLVRTMLEEAMGDVQDLWPDIERIIGLFVKLANIAGTFKK
jgi:hypothetical protein